MIISENVNQVYKDYVALKLHFTSNYDYFKYNGKTKIKEIKNKKGIYFFSKLNKKHPRDYKKYLAFSFFIYDESNYWIGNFVTQENENKYLQFKTGFENINYTFENDIKNINIKKIDKCDGFIPYIYNYYISQKISLHTYLICSFLFKRKWKLYSTDEYMYDVYMKKTEKFLPFLSMKNRNKYINILVKIIKEKSENNE